MQYAVVLLVFITFVTCIVLFTCEIKNVCKTLRIISVLVLMVSCIATSVVYLRIKYFENNFKTMFLRNQDENRQLIEASKANVSFLLAVNEYLHNKKDLSQLRNVILMAISKQRECMDSALMVPGYNLKKHIQDLRELTKEIDSINSAPVEATH